MKRADKVTHRKAILDQDVAIALGIKQSKVSVITNEFLRQLMRQLLDMNIVHLDGLGEMQMVVQKGPGHVTLHVGTFAPKESSRPMEVFVRRKYYVVFKKAAPFKEAIRARYGSAAAVVEKKHGKVRR